MQVAARRRSTIVCAARARDAGVQQRSSPRTLITCRPLLKMPRSQKASKRVPLSLRYNIARRVRRRLATVPCALLPVRRPARHHDSDACLVCSLQAKETDRKQRRDAKKNPALRKKLRKDLGIPNLNPFKTQILKKVRFVGCVCSAMRWQCAWS